VLEVVAAVEFGDVVEVEAADVAAKTHGVAISAVATTMPAIAASCTVLVFILSSMATRGPGIYWISEMTPKSLWIRPKKRPELRKWGQRGICRPTERTLVG
jgi:hypothetical protein